MSAAGSVNGGVLPDRPDLPDPSLYLVLPHLPRERIAVDAKGVGRFGETPIRSAEHAGDKALFELVDRVLELDAAVDHFFDQSLQAFRDHSRSTVGSVTADRLHPYSSSSPVRRRYASMYFSRVLSMTSSGNDGTGGCLFQRMRSR